jgi:hypothetical protein
VNENRADGVEDEHHRDIGFHGATRETSLEQGNQRNKRAGWADRVRAEWFSQIDSARMR